MQAATAIIGQYYPAQSVIHRLDPRIKLLGSIVLMIIILCAHSYPMLGVEALCLLGITLCAHIPLRALLSSIAPLAFIVVITALLNIFFVQGGTIYLAWGPIVISQDGIAAALFLCCRLLLLLISGSMLTLTTTTLDISDACETLLDPLKRFGFPSHECAMIMGIALRFLPQFIEESHIIKDARISRGAESLTQGGVKAITSRLIPLFTSAFRHADTLALAMDARCYHGGEGRTHLSPLKLATRDYASLGCMAAIIAGSFLIGLIG